MVGLNLGGPVAENGIAPVLSREETPHKETQEGGIKVASIWSGSKKIKKQIRRKGIKALDSRDQQRGKNQDVLVRRTEVQATSAEEKEL